MPCTIYMAAALFCGRETSFNIALTEALEALGHHCRLPQRDGFEFAALTDHLAEVLPAADCEAAVQHIIYHLDLGIFLPQCDRVVALLDEPQDDGVMVEICYAALANIPTLGLRTDVRSPYGSPKDPCGGAHFFPVLQCDWYLQAHMPCASRHQADQDIAQLAQNIDRQLLTADQADIHFPAPWQALINRARLLFDGLDDLHSDASLALICQRYAQHQHDFIKSSPIAV